MDYQPLLINVGVVGLCIFCCYCCCSLCTRKLFECTRHLLPDMAFAGPGKAGKYWAPVPVVRRSMQARSRTTPVYVRDDTFESTSSSIESAAPLSPRTVEKVRETPPPPLSEIRKPGRPFRQQRLPMPSPLPPPRPAVVSRPWDSPMDPKLANICENGGLFAQLARDHGGDRSHTAGRNGGRSLNSARSDDSQSPRDLQPRRWVPETPRPQTKSPGLPLESSDFRKGYIDYFRLLQEAEAASGLKHAHGNHGATAVGRGHAHGGKGGRSDLSKIRKNGSAKVASPPSAGNLGKGTALS